MSLSIGLSIGIDRSFSGQAGGGLSAPTLGYPSPLAANPSSIVMHLPADWQVPDAAKLAYSSSPSMSPSTVLSHAMSDADLAAKTATFPLPTFSGITYLQGYGNHGGLDSANLSGIVAWGDTVAPSITTAASQNAYDGVKLAVTLAATDTGGVPALISNGTSPGWYLSGGADKLQFQIAIVGGVPTLQWVGNGTQSRSSDNSFTQNNTYAVQVTAVDYGGNQSAALSMSVTNNAVTVSFGAGFTNVTNAPLNTLETSNTVTVSITPTGTPLAASVSGTGFTWSKNGGAYQAAGSIPGGIQSGDTITLQVTSANANATQETATVTVGTASTTWSVTTPGSVATLTTGNGTTGAGANKSHYLNATSFQIVLNAANGASSFDRATIAAANTKFIVETTMAFFAAGYANDFGFDQGTLNFDSPGYQLNTGYPGNSGASNGITIEATKGNTYVDVYANGTKVQPATHTAITDGDVFTTAVDTSANTVKIFQNGFLLTTVTLTSQIPTSWNSITGGLRGNGTAGAGSSDSPTVNYGGSTFAYPQTGYTYYA